MTDSLARRDWFVEAQARRMKSLGVGVPTEALQRQAGEDLRLLDNARASGDITVKKEPPRRKPVSDKASLKAGALAARVGAKSYVKRLPARDIGHRKGLKVDAIKVHAMAARLKLIGTRNTGRLRTGADMEHAFEYATLARAAAEATFNHGARRGPYAGMSDLDCDRILLRQLEDICDRSNAVIRPNWWAK